MVVVILMKSTGFIPLQLKESWIRLNFIRYGFLLKHVNASLDGSSVWLMVKRHPFFDSSTKHNVMEFHPRISNESTRRNI